MQSKTLLLAVRTWMASILLTAITGGYALAEPLITDPAWKQGVLANGLHWQILATPQRPTDRTEIRLLIRTGSLSENAHQNGYSHFLPRLALTQSGPLTVQQAQNLWRNSINPQRPLPPATTSYSFTIFRLSLPNNRADLLQQALAWLAEVPEGVKITDQTIDRALASDNMVSSWPKNTQDSWWRYRLKDSSLAAHDPNAAILLPVDIPSLSHFYQTWYTPDTITLIIVGNIDSRKLSGQITKLFGSLSGKRETPAPLPALPPLPATPVSITSSNLSGNTIALIWDAPWQPIRDDSTLINYWQSDLARETMFHYLQGKLQNTVAGKEDHLKFGCQVHFQRSQCVMSLNSPAEKINHRLEHLTQRLAALRDHGLTEEEFTALLAQKRLELQTLFATYAHTDTQTLINQQIHALRDQVVDIAPEQYQSLRQRFLDDLTREKLNQSLHQQLSHDPALVLFQPAGEAERDIQSLQQIWHNIIHPASSGQQINDSPQKHDDSNTNNGAK